MKSSPRDSTSHLPMAASNLRDFRIDSTSTCPKLYTKIIGFEGNPWAKIHPGGFKGCLSTRGSYISAKFVKMFGEKIAEIFVKVFGPDG